MNDLTLVLRQTYYGLKSTSRNPRAVMFALLFPVFFLVIFNSIFASSGSDVTINGVTVPIKTYFAGGLIAYAIMLNCFSTPLVTLTTQRESGQLKRYRGTPVPSWTFIASLILRSLVLVAMMIVVILSLGSIAYGVDINGEAIVGLVVYAVLGTAAMCALGIALSAFAPNADAASVIGPFSAVILSFVSGVFIPVDQLPAWLEDFGRVFPLYHLAAGIQTALGTSSGTGLTGNDVLSLVIWAAAGMLIAVRRFRWEPQSTRG
jgi:ABC-2 type transport system permease protein